VWGSHFAYQYAGSVDDGLVYDDGLSGFWLDPTPYYDQQFALSNFISASDVTQIRALWPLDIVGDWPAYWDSSVEWATVTVSLPEDSIPANASGADLVYSFTFAGGTADGGTSLNGNASGAALAYSLAVNGGAATGVANASGAVSSYTFSVSGGAASGAQSGFASGLAAQYSFGFAGGSATATASGNAPGYATSVQYSLSAGAATSSVDGSASGLALAVTYGFSGNGATGVITLPVGWQPVNYGTGIWAKPSAQAAAWQSSDYSSGQWFKK
jgi:hypothetical protein